MSAALTSQVIQLLYRVAPNLNLAHVASDLCQTFGPPTGPHPTQTWDCDDIVLLEFQTVHVGIGFSENLPGAHAACLTVATGPSRLHDAPVPGSPGQDRFGQSLADHLHQRFPCDTRQVQHLDQPLTTDLIDQLVEALFQTADIDPDPLPAPLSPAPAETLAAPEQGTEPGDMERLLWRLSSELTTRAPGLISRAIASATPKAHGSPDTAENGQPVQTSKSNQKPKAKSGLFWRKGQGAAPVTIDAAGDGTRKASPARELNAVRDALYAGAATQGGGARRIARQTGQVLQKMTSLRHILTTAGAEKRKSTDPVPKDQAKH